jgi:hypothetical protein
MDAKPPDTLSQFGVIIASGPQQKRSRRDDDATLTAPR